MQLDRPVYTFARGINTEASFINFPENCSLDEENYELQINGARRRRRGLQMEDGGELIDTTYTAGQAVRSFKWTQVNNDANLNFVLVQVGRALFVLNDNDTPSAEVIGEFDLVDFKVNTSTSTQVASSPVDIASGRGHFVLVGKYVKPTWISYDPDTDMFTSTGVDIKERDLVGIEDGVPISANPVTETESHSYNLFNRGWKLADLEAFRTDQSMEPSKSMVPWLGYARQDTANVAEQDWTKAFSPAKLVAELFQDASAPQGHFIRDPFDRESIILPDSSDTMQIVTWSISGTFGGFQTVTVETEAAHGLVATDDVNVINNSAKYHFGRFGKTFTFNGVNEVVSVPDTTHFTIQVTFPDEFTGWTDQFQSKGAIGFTILSDESVEAIPFRPRCTAFFAGRAWYAGTPAENLSSKIFFSQILESNAQYGKCYQVADPTDERISDILPSDGGTVVIPEANDIIRLLPYGNALLVFSTNGVWAIAGGESGYFTATSYSVRKVGGSSEGLVSAGACVLAGNIPYYCSTTDIFGIQQDPNSGFLVSTNLTEITIHTLYNNIPQASRALMQCAYDNLSKRIVCLYDNTGTLEAYQYDKSLVYDTRLQAWVKSSYAVDANRYVSSVFAVRSSLADAPGSKLKFVCFVDGKIQLSETRNEGFTDLGLTEPDAFLVTGYDVLGDASKQKQAPYIWVFSGKTETGYTALGDDLVPVRESSTSMQARWNWADNTVSGKWGRSQEVYRHLRFYQPVDVSDTFADGQPLVVTRNKLRGRGRSLHLKFQAGEGKDSWLFGWHIKYDIPELAPQRPQQ